MMSSRLWPWGRPPRELEEAEGVAGGCCVEDDAFVAERLDLLEDFGKGHGFVDTGDLFGLNAVSDASMQYQMQLLTLKARSCIMLPIPPRPDMAS
jgi:hypothetical protein